MIWEEFEAWATAFASGWPNKPTKEQLDLLRSRLSNVYLDTEPTVESRFVEVYWIRHTTTTVDTRDLRYLPLSGVYDSILAFTKLGELDRELTAPKLESAS